MDTSRFTSSLALPSEQEGAAGLVWIQQDESRQAMAAVTIHGVSKLEPQLLPKKRKQPLKHARTTCRLHVPSELSRSSSLQEARRQELKAYLQHLKRKQSAEPGADLTFGSDFYSLVQRLSQQRKTEYESIRGTASVVNCSPSSCVRNIPSSQRSHLACTTANI